MKTIIINKVRNIAKGLFPMFLLPAMTLLASCSDFLEEYSQDLARVQTVDDLDELVVGDCLLPLGYVSTANSMYSLYNKNFDLLHFMSDELDEKTTSAVPYGATLIVPTYYPYFTWQQNMFLDDEGRNSNESQEAQYWKLAYEKIGKCNMVLAEADGMTPENDDEVIKLNHIKGECHFLRANYYFMLVNLYAKPYAPSTAASTAGIPIKTTPEIEDIDYQRNSVAEVYDQIISDLTMAEQLLADYTKAKNTYRATINCVYLFRSRVAAFMQNWSEAADYARKSLALNNTLTDLTNWSSGYPISADNAEVLFSNGSSCLGNVLHRYPGRRNSYYDDYSPIYTISDHLAGLYTAADGRRKAYISNTDNSEGVWSYNKIDKSEASFNNYKTASDVFCLRTAEAYLLLAEAEAQLGNDAEACRQLNLLRAKRIEDAENVSLSGESLITFVREERERELCLEGHRWFDLRRYQVDAKYPWTTTIEHAYSKFAYDNDAWMDVRSQTSYYRLEPNDEGYTLNIPKTVRDYQLSIGSNSRPDRQPFNVVLGQ